MGANRARQIAFEATATGVWAGLTQAALGFALLHGAGASVVDYFALTACWLAGGAAGAWRVRGRAAIAVLPLALLGAALARAALGAAPFSRAPEAALLAAGALAGAYAGAFLGEGAARGAETRALLLHENNGFVTGWLAAGAALLFARAAWLDLAACLLGVIVLAGRLWGTPLTGVTRVAFVLPAALALALAARQVWPRAESWPSAHAPLAEAGGDLPADIDAIVDDLLADDLRVLGTQDVNGTVVRLDLERRGRRFRAKWKPMAPGGGEAQDGFEGNNAPRCEAAAWRVNRMLFGRRFSTRHLVAHVVVRAFHRDVPCERACMHVPRLPASLGALATFPEVNDHLVVGALTYWLDGVAHVERFEGGLWDRVRFERSAEYRRSFSDLCLFLALIAHGDANYAPNFLLRMPGLDRIYSIDNGRAFDGVDYYSDRADPDWAPFAARAAFAPRVPPAFSRRTIGALASLSRAVLARELRVVAGVDLGSGRVVREPADDPVLGSLCASPLADMPGLVRRGRGTFTGSVGGKTWVLLGIGEQGIDDVAARARALVEQFSRRSAALFDE